MKVKGIKKGRIIELAENLSIPDDSQVIVEIEVDRATIDVKLQKMKEFLATSWDGQARAISF